MIESSQKSDSSLTLAEKYVQVCGQVGELSDKSSDLETALVRERAIRERLIGEEVQYRLAKERQHLEAEVRSQMESALESLAQSLDSRERNLSEREQSLEKRKAQFLSEIESIRLQDQVLFGQQLDRIKLDCELRVSELLSESIKTFLAQMKNDPLALSKQLDTFKLKTEETEQLLNKDIVSKLQETLARNKGKETQTAKLVRMLFTQKSERWNPENAELYDVDLDQEVVITESDKAEVRHCREVLAAYREQRKLVLLEQQLSSESHGRTDMTKDLPVLETLTLYPDVYTANPDDFEIIGIDEKRVIVPIRTKYMVRIYRRPVLVRKSDDLRCPVQSELPEPIIWKSYSSPELLAQIEVDKYKNHLPFYRQLQMMKRDGLELSRSTLDGWHDESCAVLEPLYELQKRIVMSSLLLAGDGSPMPVIDNDKHRTVKNYIICFRSIDTGLPLFVTSPGGRRTKAVIMGHLSEWTGVAFMCDAYAGYDWIGKVGGKTLCRCFSHARREMECSLRENKKVAGKGMRFYQQIAAVEEIIAYKKLAGDEKVKFRQENAGPLWRVFKQWAMKQMLELPNISLSCKAMGYLVRNYDSLTAYLNIADMPLSNNDTERAIREMVMGKKAYLFCGNELSVHNAAVMYTFFGVCKVKDINPYNWLVYVMNHIKTWPEDRLAELLPQNWIEPDKK